MVYQGSKSKLAKYLVPIIQSYIDDNNATTYIELFGGGANIIDKIQCNKKIYVDINEDLVALLKYVQKDPNISIAPSECSFEHYSEVRADKEHKVYSQEYRALIGYMASYGGRYFDGGYGRDAKGSRSIYTERLNNLKEQAPNLCKIDFYCKDYMEIDFDNYKDCVFYLDPPYKGTKQYSKQSMNYDYFYNLCRKLSKNNIVLISEYNMPDDFECIWEKERTVLQKSNRIIGDKAIEKLFIYKKEKTNE